MLILIGLFIIAGFPLLLNYLFGKYEILSSNLENRFYDFRRVPREIVGIEYVEKIRKKINRKNMMF